MELLRYAVFTSQEQFYDMKPLVSCRITDTYCRFMPSRLNILSREVIILDLVTNSLYGLISMEAGRILTQATSLPSQFQTLSILCIKRYQINSSEAPNSTIVIEPHTAPILYFDLRIIPTVYPIKSPILFDSMDPISVLQ